MNSSLPSRLGLFLSFCTAPLALVIPAPAQSSPLITVGLENILADLAVDLNIAASAVPRTAHVPIDVAANVCALAIDVLSAQVQSGNTSCLAVTGSQELAQIVTQQIVNSGQSIPEGGASGGQTIERAEDSPVGASPTGKTGG